MRIYDSDGALLAILLSLLGEAKRKNGNCLSPVKRDEFFHFSGASLQKAQQWSNRRERRFLPQNQSERIFEYQYNIASRSHGIADKKRLLKERKHDQQNLQGTRH
jgi:hypothetical protein